MVKKRRPTTATSPTGEDEGLSIPLGGSSPASASGVSPSQSSSNGSPRWQSSGRLRRRRGRKRSAPRLCFMLFWILALPFCVGILLRRRRLRSANSIDLTFGGHVPLVSFATHLTDAPKCHRLEDDDEIDYTVVTQFSENRLWMMEHHCQRWKHRMSLAVLTNATTTPVDIKTKLKQMRCDTSQINIQTLSDHAVEDYPVNVLRNMALRAVTTSHIVYLDIDFWPSNDLHEILQTPNVKRRLIQDDRAALVIPAFQLMRQCREWRECPENNIFQMPHNTSQLAELVRHRKASPFDPTNPGGHGSTLYSAWSKQQQTTIVLLKLPCVKSNRYEPYLVVRYCDKLPPFQEPFSGYGKNKMTWVMQLLRQGYALWQIPRAFVTHYPHLDSSARQKWNGGTTGRPGQRLPDKASVQEWMETPRGRADYVFLQFRTWLYHTVPSKRRVPVCPAVEDDDYKLWIHRDEPVWEEEEGESEEQ